jgi:diadenosine tetraphosphate (Ap4A) HIT family hydrolase
LLQNSLAVVVRDQYPVSDWHLLVIPKRHTADYFDLGSAEVRACQTLLAEARNLVLKENPTVVGLNVGINSGTAAGQTVMYSHIHLIPRREGDLSRVSPLSAIQRIRDGNSVLLSSFGRSKRL